MIDSGSVLKFGNGLSRGFQEQFIAFDLIRINGSQHFEVCIFVCHAGTRHSGGTDGIGFEVDHIFGAVDFDCSEITVDS